VVAAGSQGLPRIRQAGVGANGIGVHGLDSARAHRSEEPTDDCRVQPLQDRPSRNAEFDEAYRRAGALLDVSHHCQRWEAARCVDEPEKQILLIEWNSAEGHLQGFRQSADFEPFRDATQPFFNEIEEMTHYRVTANG
jgi:hypothetical protein